MGSVHSIGLPSNFVRQGVGGSSRRSSALLDAHGGSGNGESALWCLRCRLLAVVEVDIVGLASAGLSLYSFREVV